MGIIIMIVGSEGVAGLSGTGREGGGVVEGEAAAG